MWPGLFLFEPGKEMGKVELEIRCHIIIFSYYPETEINTINCALYYMNQDELKLTVIIKYIICFSLDNEFKGLLILLRQWKVTLINN